MSPSLVLASALIRGNSGNYGSVLCDIAIIVDTGNASGGGAGNHGNPMTVTASAQAGYCFVNWVQRTPTNYTFLADGTPNGNAYYADLNLTNPAAPFTTMGILNAASMRLCRMSVSLP